MHLAFASRVEFVFCLLSEKLRERDQHVCT